MDTQIEAVLSKLHRKTYATLTSKQVTAALSALGWRIEKMAYMVASDTICVSKQSEEEVRGKHEDISYAVVKAVPDPAKAKAHRPYVLKLTEPVMTVMRANEYRSERRLWGFTYQEYTKVNGHRFTAPDGRTFDVYGGTHRGHTPQALLKWGFEQADLEQQVCDKLGVAKFVHSWERPRQPTGGQLLGTCAICGSEQVTRSGRMVLHGYRRPGWGWIDGECFGVGFFALNLSHEACDAYLAELARERGATVEFLALLKADKVDPLPPTRIEKYGQPEQPTPRGHEHFERERKKLIERQEGRIMSLDAASEEMRRRIAAWKPTALRGAA